MLNWFPKYSLEEGLKETIDWDKIFLSKQDHQNSKEM
ncbi:Putative sugar dehydratase/epimerase yfnG [Planktothrix rubescens]|nr:Putative sugar dehydratase/epimerase yfnG [Planktothrix rubescens]